jgi:hypothetical protein
MLQGMQGAPSFPLQDKCGTVMYSQRIFCTDTLNVGACLLQSRPPLLSLNLTHYTFGQKAGDDRPPTDIAALAAYLQSNDTLLRSLRLYHVAFLHGQDLCRLVSDGILRCRPLERLVVESVQWDVPPVTDPLPLLLRHRGKMLSVSGFPVHNANANGDPPPVEAVTTTTTVAVVNLSLRRLHLTTLQVCQHLCTGHGQRLRSLCLDQNLLASDAWAVLGELLASPKCALLSLHVARNRLTEINMEHFAHGLSRNSSLRSLNIANNYIGQKGLYDLQRVLHPRLRSLNLSYNNFRFTTFHLLQLLTVLRKNNPALRRIQLRGTLLLEERPQQAGDGPYLYLPARLRQLFPSLLVMVSAP